MNQRPWSPISCKCNELNLMTMMLGLSNPISFKKGDKYLITKKKKKKKPYGQRGSGKGLY